MADLIGRKFATLAPSHSPKEKPADESHLRVIELNTHVLVAGGGMSGVCAALAAARNGAKVILVQDRSRLGGNSSSEVRMHIVGANWHKNRPGWRESGILEELRLDDAVNNPQRCREMWDALLYSKVVSEPNLTLLLESSVVVAAVSGDRITEVQVRCEPTEHLYRIRAEIFCDCTGDSRLALEAGAEYRRGREARAEFGESLAPEYPDEETLGSSILFTARRHERAMPFRAPQWARKITREQLQKRTIKSWEYGYWWIEWGGHLNTITDNQRIRHELLTIVLGIWDYIKNSGDVANTENWALDWVGMLPGKRESRRIVGDHILTERDLLSGGDFEDAVAIGGWPMDDHPPGGFDRVGDSPGRQVATADVYNIPFRCLYSRNIVNLMMAGRNISASHVAFTSTRVMGTCSVLGQAVGTGAALCARHGLTPRELYSDKHRLAELQQTLLRDDQTIKGFINQDEQDLARRAKVRASAEHKDAKAVCVIDGCLRDAPGATVKSLPEQDVPLAMVGTAAPAPRATHHWAAPIGPEGVWLELVWGSPVTLRTLQITFDSGFHRELTLTSSDYINDGIVRSAQPETVRDYVVKVRPAGSAELVPLVEVVDNHQRVNRHAFAPVTVDALRIQVRATNGDGFARIFEVRCYA